MPQSIREIWTSEIERGRENVEVEIETMEVLGRIERAEAEKMKAMNARIARCCQRMMIEATRNYMRELEAKKKGNPMNVYERIQAGHYKTKKPWSANATIKAIKARRMRDEYRADESRLTELFWSDLADEFGIAKNDPFFSEFRRMVWEVGHSNGLSEVYNFATEYKTLIDLYLAKAVK